MLSECENRKQFYIDMCTTKNTCIMHAPKKDFEKGQKRTPSGIGCINGRLWFKGPALFEQWFPTNGYRLGILLLVQGTVEVCHNNIFNFICLLNITISIANFPFKGKFLIFSGWIYKKNIQKYVSQLWIPWWNWPPTYLCEHSFSISLFKRKKTTESAYRKRLKIKINQFYPCYRCLHW